MTEIEREKYLLKLDEDLLKGSVIPSVWSTFLILESDTAFIHGAHLAALITAMAGLEAQLRFDHSKPGDGLSLAKLIDMSSLPADLKSEIHELRRFRNRWVHVLDPGGDSLDEHMWDPYAFQVETEPWALRAVTALRRAFYWCQGT